MWVSSRFSIAHSWNGWSFLRNLCKHDRPTSLRSRIPLGFFRISLANSTTVTGSFTYLISALDAQGEGIDGVPGITLRTGGLQSVTFKFPKLFVFSSLRNHVVLLKPCRGFVLPTYVVLQYSHECESFLYGHEIMSFPAQTAWKSCHQISSWISSPCAPLRLSGHSSQIRHENYVDELRTRHISLHMSTSWCSLAPHKHNMRINWLRSCHFFL